MVIGTTLNIHAIILALNEEIFIKAQLDTIYPFCNRISVITQYDRDWYGSAVKPDKTTNIVLNYPDPDSKINLLVRRLPDEAAARNMEMLAFNRKSYKNTISHGRSMDDIKSFHNPPDYFWIIDADELYDTDTIPAMLNYLTNNRPNGMRVTGYNYIRNWHQRVPRAVVDFTHFGFIKPGILFEQRRTVSWNQSRIAKLLKMAHLPDFSNKLYGFVTCPESVGVFHHGCWLGDNKRITEKFSKSSHRESKDFESDSVDRISFEYIPFNKLPINIQKAEWPLNYIDE
jgi:hypothetical protein